MSRYGRTQSLSRHRSWKESEGTSPLQSPKGSSSAGLPNSSVTKKWLRKRGRKALWLLLLLLLVVFLLEWRYLLSLRHTILSKSNRSVGSSPVLSLPKRFEGPATPMYERLLSLAAHALAERFSKEEPDELWKEPIMGSSQWTPCADNRTVAQVAPPEPGQSSGYIVVSADGGLNQQRVAICNAVAVARLLNATLVLPKFLVSSVWRDTSQFDDIYEKAYFMKYLKDDVHILSELPVELQSLDLAIMGSILTNADVPKESKPSFFVEMVLPIVHRNRVVHFVGFENALSFDPIPFDLQRLRCRCNYHALKFKPHIREAAGIMIKRMRDKSLRWGPVDNSLSSEHQLSTIEKQLIGDIGIPNSIQSGSRVQVDEQVEHYGSVPIKYLGLHLRFEMDMVAYSLCEFGGGEAEKEELANYRMIHFPTLSKYQESGKLMSADQLRADGRCPLTPEEAVLMLASLGFKRSTRIFLAGAHIYGGQTRIAAITSLYPNLVTKEDLLTPEELAPFVNHSSQMAALDFIGCAVADAFAMTDSGSQLASLASGYRIYYGEGQLPTIRPNKRRLASYFLQNMTMEWEEFEEKIRKAVRESKRLLVRPVARSVYRHPRCNECMCR
ncbi:unnamed protein product [Calypogeia fissa]